MIHHGDCLDVLRTLEADSIDACVTDPPYELAFMGKRWDGTGVAFKPETWAAVLRVLKPGAHLCAFGGTRTFHRMTCAIEDAGFEIRDCLSWLYGSGFPKSLDVSKAIDKAAGANRTEVVGSKLGRPGMAKDGRNQSYDSSINTYGSGGVLSSDITAPATDAAKQWAGWGTALKPAHELIVLARKPFPGTIAANVLKHGTAALNIDECRVEGESWGKRPANEMGARRGGIMGEAVARKEEVASDLGRWPANVLLDDVAAAMLDEQAGERPGCKTASAATPESKFRLGQGLYMPQGRIYGDTGGASRFYYVAKPSREEREYGCELLTRQQRDESRKQGNPGGDNPRNRGLDPRGNSHPTVKPVEVLRWLVKLITPPNGTVLDPFLGSGSTGMACRYEHRDFIGIERERDYVEIAERRIAAVAPLFAEVRP